MNKYNAIKRKKTDNRLSLCVLLKMNVNSRPNSIAKLSIEIFTVFHSTPAVFDGIWTLLFIGIAF